MNINITQISQYTQPQLISWVHSITAIPSLIILFVSMLLVMLIIGLIIFKNKTKFWVLWGATAVIGGSILIALIYLPNITVKIVDTFKSLITF